MTMMCKINKLEKSGGPSAFFKPYLADLLPFMVIFKRTLRRQSGPPAYHHQFDMQKYEYSELEFNALYIEIKHKCETDFLRTK